LELSYTSYDLKLFAESMGYSGEPFAWDEKRRALLRSELDAYYARLYGLNRKQLRYILDPADLTRRELEDILDPWEEIGDPLDPAGYDARRAASDFPGETFRVLKDKEFRQFGEYRTRRLVLEAWDRLEGVAVGGEKWLKNERPVLPAPKQETNPTAQPTGESKPAAGADRPAAPVKAASAVVKEGEGPGGQPMLSDFGVYKCEVCGKMVMGYEKEGHEREKHGGNGVEWRKVR
jgi:hypothetical protein